MRIISAIMNEQVKNWRTTLRISQKELGIAIGKDKKIARHHIDDIERGRKKLTADDYVAIQDLLEQQSLEQASEQELSNKNDDAKRGNSGTAQAVTPASYL